MDYNENTTINNNDNSNNILYKYYYIIYILSSIIITITMCYIYTSLYGLLSNTTTCSIMFASSPYPFL